MGGGEGGASAAVRWGDPGGLGEGVGKGVLGINKWGFCCQSRDLSD